MERASECWLLHETPGTHGVHDGPTVSERHRLCTVSSVRRSEAYAAFAVGLQPTRVIKLAAYGEYDDEQTLRHEGHVWRVIRVYETADGGIELTVQRSDTE